MALVLINIQSSWSCCCHLICFGLFVYSSRGPRGHARILINKTHIPVSRSQRWPPIRTRVQRWKVANHFLADEFEEPHEWREFMTATGSPDEVGSFGGVEYTKNGPVMRVCVPVHFDEEHLVYVHLMGEKEFIYGEPGLLTGVRKGIFCERHDVDPATFPVVTCWSVKMSVGDFFLQPLAYWHKVRTAESLRRCRLSTSHVRSYYFCARRPCYTVFTSCSLTCTQRAGLHKGHSFVSGGVLVPHRRGDRPTKNARWSYMKLILLPVLCTPSDMYYITHPTDTM